MHADNTDMRVISEAIERDICIRNVRALDWGHGQLHFASREVFDELVQELVLTSFTSIMLF